MIQASRATQLENAGEFAAGLRDWLTGDGVDGEAAGSIVAETLLMHRKWLQSKFKK